MTRAVSSSELAASCANCACLLARFPYLPISISPRLPSTRCADINSVTVPNATPTTPDVPTWEQYFRDLAVFGSNAIELIPPRSDDDATSPHFHRPPMEMMIGMSGLADAYGLDVWIWYPAMDKDYSDPATVEFALKEWSAVFRQLPRIDAVFVPGGDPGHTEPKYLMALLEKQTQNLHRFHPKAQMWVSPQSFNREWMNEFIE